MICFDPGNSFVKSLTVVWSKMSQLHEMFCHDLEVMGSNLVRLKLGLHGVSVC